MDQMTIHDVLRCLPHRFPFLMVDRVTEYKPGEYLDGIKNVSFNEPYFQGHFPVRPVMPGVLILEALAQATGILAFKTQEHRGEGGDRQQLYLFVGIDEARFRRQVEPGDQLHLHVEHVRTMRGIWRFNGEARVDGEVVASATLMCAGKDVES